MVCRLRGGDQCLFCYKDTSWQCQHATWSMTGLTSGEFLSLAALQEVRHQDKEYKLWSFVGKILGGGEDEKGGRVHAGDRVEMVARFPDDIAPFTEEQARRTLRSYQDYKKQCEKRGQDYDKRRVWTEERYEACINGDTLARRCAMNDYLWEAYCISGGRIGVETARRVFQALLDTDDYYMAKEDNEKQTVLQKVWGVLSDGQ